MQDAVLIYYMIANLLHAGYFADIAKAMRQAAKQFDTAVIGLRNSNKRVWSVANGTRSQMADCVPTKYREFEDWAERLTRMESYVLSMG